MTPNALSALRWHVDAGADEAIDEAPRNRFAAVPKPVATGPAPAAPKGTARALAAANETADNIVQAARETAAACQDLATLREALATFDGCALKATAKSLVFGDGNPEAPLMLVGEAPGADEDREGRPFVGVSGQLLDRMLAAIGQDRS
ncbi:MAG: uracil-DNA glycosylase, partial [Rhodospirillaceae bacterium]|nr:uracil-DNA glycosylase [Rhodospirillaceae bacterium]